MVEAGGCFSMYKSLIALALLGSAAVVTPALAAPPIEAYGRLPGMDHTALSPSGQNWAYISAVGGKRRLVASDANDKILASSIVDDVKVRDLQWAGEDLLVLTTSSTQKFNHDEHSKMEVSQVLVLDVRQKKVQVLFNKHDHTLPAVFGRYGLRKIGGRWYGFYAGITMEFSLNGEPFMGHGYADLYRVDLQTGDLKMVGHGSDFDHDWVVDPNGAVLLRTEYDQNSSNWRLIRGGLSGKTLVSRKTALNNDMGLLGLGRTPQTVLLYDSTGDHEAIREIAVDGDGTGPELFASLRDPTLLRDPETGVLIGAVSADGELEALDPKLQARFNTAKRALKGRRVELKSFTAGFDRMLVHTDGGDDSGSFWIVDMFSKDVHPVALEYPDVEAKDVGATRLFTYKAADGLALDGVLTLPPGRDGKNLPVVVMPHGGPLGVNDEPGFDWWAQAFASRGYAVFQPNYRGSSGHGAELVRAGYGTWGRQMQTDVSDGLSALAAQGIVDPKRACVVGASYGGYAALAGVTLQHGIYKCAVSYGGVFDLKSMLAWDGYYDRNTDEIRFWRAAMGAKSGSDPILGQLSPAQHADKADAPVLLIHGGDDTVVNIEQSQKMARALKAAGKPVELIVLPHEDHWLSHEDTRMQTVKASVEFVEKNNPPA